MGADGLNCQYKCQMIGENYTSEIYGHNRDSNDKQKCLCVQIELTRARTVITQCLLSLFSKKIFVQITWQAGLTYMVKPVCFTYSDMRLIQWTGQRQKSGFRTPELRGGLDSTESGDYNYLFSNVRPHFTDLFVHKFSFIPGLGLVELSIFLSQM